MVRRALFALALIGLGWGAAKAQTPPTPDFELKVVTSAEGKTLVECVTGCGLQWIERIAPSRDKAKKDFSFGCGTNAWERLPDGCPSGRLGGWITK
jgi:hypothetical protein